MTDAATTKASLNKFEKFKAEKMASREGGIGPIFLLAGKPWMKPDREHRLKWVGVFFAQSLPVSYDAMRIPNIVTSNQMRVLGEVVQRYGDDGKTLPPGRIFSCGASGLRMCQIFSNGFSQLG